MGRPLGASDRRPLPSQVGLPALIGNGGRTLVTVPDAEALQLLAVRLDFPLPEPEWLATLVELQAGARADARGVVQPIADRRGSLLALRTALAGQPAGWWRDWDVQMVDRLVATGSAARPVKTP